MKQTAKIAAVAVAAAGLWMYGGQLPAYAAGESGRAAEHVTESLPMTALTKVYGDGEKVAAAMIAYPKELNAADVGIKDFSVLGKKIASVHVNNKEDFTGSAKKGRYVFLEFAYENTVYDGDLAKKPGRPKESSHNGTDAPSHSERKLPDLTLQITQVRPLKAADGSLMEANGRKITGTAVIEPDIARFRQDVYTDPETGNSMPYNLYLPEHYNPQKKYPLLFFVADASANINAVTTPLFQGNGATVWATPAEQARHECIVLAPQYTADLVEKLGMMTTDENKWTDGLTLISRLLFDVMGRYSVDMNRIYGTGQSQGGMTNIALSDKYPDLFAGQLLVACQWNAKEMEVLKDKNLWIVVCEGDTKAFPGMNEAVARWEALGSNVARNQPFWDSKAPLETINKAVRGMAAQGRHINYSVFAGGNHMYTWSFAYNIGALRDWLFEQRLSPDASRGQHSEVSRALMDAGISYYKAGDYTDALKIFQAADSRGHMKAPRYLGLCYEYGYGVARDAGKAAFYYQKSADRGDITGTCRLGYLYEQGLGVARDYGRAMELYKKSAQRGDIIAAPGMVAVGKMYAAGLGVPKDLTEARAWFQKALAAGYNEAADELKTLE